MSDNHVPPMVHELGRHWRQPDPARILIDDAHALMDRATFEALPEYSGTIPTGVYPGKMWRRHDGAYEFAQRRTTKPPRWLLGWYGECDDPKRCSVNFREVLLV